MASVDGLYVNGPKGQFLPKSGLFSFLLVDSPRPVCVLPVGVPTSGVASSWNFAFGVVLSKQVVRSPDPATALEAGAWQFARRGEGGSLFFLSLFFLERGSFSDIFPRAALDFCLAESVSTIPGPLGGPSGSALDLGYSLHQTGPTSRLFG